MTLELFLPTLRRGALPLELPAGGGGLLRKAVIGPNVNTYDYDWRSRGEAVTGPNSSGLPASRILSESPGRHLPVLPLRVWRREVP